MGVTLHTLRNIFLFVVSNGSTPSISLEVGLHKGLLDSLLRVSLESELFKRLVIGELHRRQGVRGATRREKKT